MATHFDSVPQFNSYIQEIPMDLAAQVDYRKQQAYNQGVQPVQFAVDKVAGIDVIKDEDKQLLTTEAFLIMFIYPKYPDIMT